MSKKEIIAQLEKNVELLLEAHQKALRDNGELQKRCNHLESKLKKVQDELLEKRKRIEVLELSSSVSSSQGNNSAKVLIDRLLREVDKCIETVSSRL
ncbi:MAG: hypothetical protein KBS95_03125 [Alistipes sp.]|nr:hypothetical protein [Candidatus Alistipes equi]